MEFQIGDRVKYTGNDFGMPDELINIEAVVERTHYPDISKAIVWINYGDLARRGPWGGGLWAVDKDHLEFIDYPDNRAALHLLKK